MWHLKIVAQKLISDTLSGFGNISLQNKLHQKKICLSLFFRNLKMDLLKWKTWKFLHQQWSYFIAFISLLFFSNVPLCFYASLKANSISLMEALDLDNFCPSLHICSPSFHPQPGLTPGFALTQVQHQLLLNFIRSQGPTSPACPGPSGWIHPSGVSAAPLWPLSL